MIPWLNGRTRKKEWFAFVRMFPEYPNSIYAFWTNKEKQRKAAAQKKKGGNVLKDEVDLRDLAKNALLPIQKKLQGIYTPGEGRDEWKEGKEMSTVNLVEALIQEAKSNKNLVC
jgi:hypothetical protein